VEIPKIPRAKSPWKKKKKARALPRNDILGNPLPFQQNVRDNEDWIISKRGRKENLVGTIAQYSVR